jgi:hypothetical protein
LLELEQLLHPTPPPRSTGLLVVLLELQHACSITGVIVGFIVTTFTCTFPGAAAAAISLLPNYLPVISNYTVAASNTVTATIAVNNQRSV